MIAPPTGAGRESTARCGDGGRGMSQSPGRSAVLVVLAILVVGVSAWTTGTILIHFPVAADVHIPLEAARRWLTGGAPYVADAFSYSSGYDLPFLYPPFVLPVLAPFTLLPEALVAGAWLAAGIVAALFASRTLGFPWWASGLALLWPPFAEALVTGNVQLFLVAAFVALFFQPRGVAFAPSERSLDSRGPRTTARNGLLATAVGIVKVAQIHPWLHLARVRPRAAAVGALTALLLVAGTLPATGFGLWGQWVSQLNRAADPDWVAAGAPLASLIGTTAAFGAAILSLVAAVVVRRPNAGAWIGLLMVVAAPNLHTFAWLFTLPALLVVRREVGLVVAILIASYNPVLAWIGVAGVGWAMVAGTRWPVLLEQQMAVLQGVA